MVVFVVARRGRLRRAQRRRSRCYTGSASVVQGLFPLIFVILFLSSAFFPVNLLLEPAGSIAEYNPLSFIVEGIREPVISARSARGRSRGARRDRAGRWRSRPGSQRSPCARQDPGGLGALMGASRANIATVRALVRRASQRAPARARARRSRACSRRRSSSSG